MRLGLHYIVLYCLCRFRRFAISRVSILLNCLGKHEHLSLCFACCQVTLLRYCSLTQHPSRTLSSQIWDIYVNPFKNVQLCFGAIDTAREKEKKSLLCNICFLLDHFYRIRNFKVNFFFSNETSKHQIISYSRAKTETLIAHTQIQANPAKILCC